LIARLSQAGNLQDSLNEGASEVMDMLGADGLAYNFNGHIEVAGNVPEGNDLHRLFYWLQVQSPDHLVHLPSVTKVFEEGAAFATVGSGLLALPVVPEKGNFVVAFRPEAIEEVAWGGNPHEALQHGAATHMKHCSLKPMVKPTIREIPSMFGNKRCGIPQGHGQPKSCR
jgi:two-component system, chemotaxis family, sensor kinase Cph1